MSLKGILCTLCIILFTTLFSDASTNLNNALVIDIGTDTFKSSVLTLDKRPFFQVLLNTESKRKTPTVIAFNDGLPVMGDDAANLITRFPAKVHTNFFHFIGQSYDLCKNSSTTLRRGHRTANVVENQFRRDHIALYNEDLKSAMTPEELVALTLKEAKKQAEKVVKRAVVNLIITVPPFFTYEQRLILQDAASLAGLTLQVIVDDPIATALAYGYERFLTEEGDIKNVAFFDLGSSLTRASIVQFNKIHGNTNTVKAKLISSLWDFEVSGDQIDMLLAEFMLKEAANGHNSARDLRSNPKAVEKIFREAKKLKETLSANKEATVVIENITPEYDFRLTVTRSQFEEIVDSTFVTLDAMAQELLKASSLSASDIHEIELVGGISRVPKVQKVIADRFEKEVSYHINGDEGNLLGASYLASSIHSKQESVFDLQYPLLPLSASYPSGNSVELPWQFSLGSSAYLALPVTKKDSLTLDLDLAQSNFKKSDPRVKNHFGTIQFKNVEEVKNAKGLGSYMDAIVKLTFDVEGVDVSASLDNGDGSTQIRVLENADQLDSQNLLTIEKSVSIKLMDTQEKSNSKSKIRTLEEKQQMKGQLDEAKSNLESSVFTAKEVINTMDEYVTAEDRAAIAALITQAETLLEADEADQQGFVASLTTIKDAINPVIFRSEEYRKQIIATGAAKEFIKLVKNKFNDILSKKKGESAEKEKQVLASLKEMEDWLLQKETEQESVPKTQNPVFLAEDIHKRTVKLEGQYKEALGIKDKSTKKEPEEFMSMQMKLGLFVVLILIIGIGAPLGYRYYAEIDELKGGRRLGTKKEKKEREKMKKQM